MQLMGRRVTVKAGIPSLTGEELGPRRNVGKGKDGWHPDGSS